LDWSRLIFEKGLNVIRRLLKRRPIHRRWGRGLVSREDVERQWEEGSSDKGLLRNLEP
jgi:hypothetical protein